MLNRQPSAPRDFLSRYECKYLLPKALVPELRMRIQPFVEPDRHALSWPGYRYPIGSLYLDTPNLGLFQQTEHGEKNRFKLRIRAYNDDPASPVFFEVKKRMNGVVRKWRRAARRSIAMQFLAGRPIGGDERDRAPDLGEFIGNARQIDAGPVFRVRYEREAYESRGGEPTRITFDTKLAYNVTTDADLNVGGPGWERALHGKAILEVKFTERFPTWIQDLVDTFNLDRISVPKYGISVNQALSRHECTVPIVRHRSVATGA